MTSYLDDLGLAHILADTADDIAKSRFRASDLQVSSKPDATPVTDADTAIEQALRGVLARARPRDAVLGEEFAFHAGSAAASRQWVIDPIDGTKNFLRGVPIWATLIALFDNDVPVVGLVSAPALGQRWWASIGAGAYAGKHQSSARPISVSKVANVADASIAYASLHGWGEIGRLDEFLRLTHRAWRTRGYGDFYGHVLVAEGAVDVMIEPELALWDLAALIPIITEAGGTFTDIDGTSGPHISSGISTNGLLHSEIVNSLRRPT